MDASKAASAIALPGLSRPAIVLGLSAWSSDSLQRYKSLLRVVNRLLAYSYLESV